MGARGHGKAAETAAETAQAAAEAAQAASAAAAQAGSRSDSCRTRLLALMGTVLAVATLPLAVASAGPAGETERVAIRTPGPDDGRGTGDGPRGVFARSPLSRFGLATAISCGPQLSSADGIEAQTCVMRQGWQTWARTYYRNVTGEELSSVLSFMGPGGHSVQMRCEVASADEPETCETPRQRLRGAPGAYSAVAEFAGADGDGPLLLRCGSDVAGMPGR